MLFSSWLRNWKRSLERRSSLKQTRRKKPAARRLAGRLRLEALEDRLAPAILTVNTTADNTTDTSVLTLRDAITLVNNAGNPASLGQSTMPAGWQSQISGTFGSNDTIDFNITSASDTGGGFNSTTGVATIAPLSALPEMSNGVLINGYSQPGASPNTLAQGDNAVLKIQLDLSAESVNYGYGLYVGSNTTIRGLVMNDLTAPSGGDYAILLDGDNNQVQGCFLGTDVSGSTVVGGGSGTYGIFQYGSSNLIGGTSPDARNLISGFGQGIASGLQGTPQEHQFVEGNFIGTDASGTKALGNATGVRAGYNYDWTITGNLISGNQIGIDGSFATEEIQGNLIGTDVTGTIALGNGTGVVVGLSGTVGGTTEAARNIISGNGTGIAAGPQTSFLIKGNYIGTDITGTKAVGNHVGVSLGGGASLGGTASGDGNVISGNDTAINLYGGNNVVQGNLIGTDYTGTQELLNPYVGIVVQGNNNLIGGLDTNAPGAPLAGAGNVIIAPVHGGGPAIGIGNGSGNMIEGNYIGTDITGTQVLGNDPAVLFGAGATGNTVGGTTAAARNIIATAYITPTIEFSGSATSLSSNNVVEGNYIGMDATGTKLLGNGPPVLGQFMAGVLFKDYASNNTIGGTAAGAGNIIADSYWGIITHASGGTVGNSFLGNSIFGNSFLGIELDGGNNDQAAPVLTTATSSATSTTISGTLASVANSTFRIEFFSNHGLDASGNAEGQTYLGFTTVTTDSNGNASFTATNLAAIPAGQGYLAATATNQSTGDTSQFSNYLTAPTSTVLTASANPSLLNQPVTFTATVSSSFGTPTGSVGFVDTTTNTDLGTFALSSNGAASVTVSTLAVGSHVIEAIYAGQGFFLGSSGTLTQQVSYKFSGFLPPLGNGLAFAINRTIPIKFTLSDANGNAITSLSAVTSLQIQALDANGNPVGAPFNPSSTDNQGLQFSGGQYQFNWQTKGLAAGSYEIVLKLADGTTQTKTIKLTAGGSSAGLVTDGTGGTTTAGALLGGEVDLYVDNSNGDLTSDELARINDAVTSIDATIAPYGVTIAAVSDPTQANVKLNMNTTSSLGGAAQGVLGCTTDADQVTMIEGWNWYAGSDPTQVGSGQYDFETAVMHELGHVLGLGHSGDSTSVMYASLAAGAANRVLVTADLNVSDNDGGGPCALHAVPATTASSPSTSVPLGGLTPPVQSGNPLSVMDQVFADFALLLSDVRNAYQSELSSMSALWQSADALALQRLDALLSMQAGAMGLSKDSLMRDFLFARRFSSNA